MLAMHNKFLELGLESPYSDERLSRWIEAEASREEGEHPAIPQIVVDVRGFISNAREALLAHETQIDPNSRHWFGLPAEVADELHPFEEYDVARDLTAGVGDGTDLFAGVGSFPAGRR
jgi:mycothiol S-conjugate amidase